MTSRRTVLKSVLCMAPLGATALCATAGSPGKTSGLADLGVREAVEHVRSGALKVETYVGALLERYIAHQHLNTVITIDSARVMEAARAIDSARGRGDKLGLLCGVPFAVKDQIDVEGYPTTAGNVALKGYVAKQSASLISRMIGHGGIVFAKANCADMVGQVSPGGATSSNPYFGFVRNPYNPAHIPGGSSGGSAAIVAARIVPAAIGEDTGGSVRLPASCCGIAGLRPSTYTPENFLGRSKRKRYPDDGMIAPAQPLDTYGPMARTVADVAYLDSVITGEQPVSLSLRDARIGIPRADYWQRDIADPQIERVIREALSRLGQAGATLIEYDLNALLRLNDGAVLWKTLSPPNDDLAQWLIRNAPTVSIAELNRLRDSYPPRSGFAAREPMSAQRRSQIVADAARAYAQVFATNGLHAIAFPTLLIPPPLINSNGDTPGQKIQVNGQWVDEFSTLITNIFWGPCLGAPGLNVPVGMHAGLPVGLSLQGLPGSDSSLLGLGIAAENELGSLPPPPMT